MAYDARRRRLLPQVGLPWVVCLRCLLEGPGVSSTAVSRVTARRQSRFVNPTQAHALEFPPRTSPHEDEGGGGEAATTTRNEGPQVALTFLALQEADTETDQAPTKRLEGADPMTVKVRSSRPRSCVRDRLLGFAGFNHARVVDFIAKVSCKAAGGEKKVGFEVVVGRFEGGGSRVAVPVGFFLQLTVTVVSW